MGRNRKVFMRDIGLYRDPKLRAARQKFGVLGKCVRNTLSTRTVAAPEYTAGLENVTIETLAAVVDQLAASGLFHAALYERGFLTSKRIQNHRKTKCPADQL